ncbi:hypothetical protein SLE2022_367450 [Rubroshorea leprosula]
MTYQGVFKVKSGPSLCSSLGFISLLYYLLIRFPKGIPRLLLLPPIIYLFYLIPWYSSSSLLRGVSSFFLTWLASFKLLLFCFDQGPLANCKSYLDFVLVSIFPLKIKENQTPSNIQFMSLYESVSLFNKPYLATSLQDFWGRRWNRYSSNILRMTIYDPTRKTLTGIVGIQSAKVIALILTLVVSCIMHEMLFYYITCAKKPTWEVTWFFVLQGLCMALEVVLKKLARANGWTQVHPAVSRSLTCGFVVATFYGLLVLPVWRNGQNDCGFR